MKEEEGSKMKEWREGGKHGREGEERTGRKEARRREGGPGVKTCLVH